MNIIKRILIILILIIIGLFVVYGALNIFNKKTETEIIPSDSISDTTNNTNTRTEKQRADFVYSFDQDDDNDELPNAKEIIYDSDPKNPDTDGDSYLDGSEIINGYDPIAAGSTRLAERQDKNFTIQYFTWAQEKYGVKNPYLQDSSINDYLSMRFPIILEMPVISNKDINITYSEDKQIMREYIAALNNIELPQNFSNYPELYEKTFAGEQVEIDSIIEQINSGAKKLYNLSVPIKALEIHKQYLGILETLKIIFSDLKNTQKDPVLIKLGIKKGQELTKIASGLEKEKEKLLEQSQ